LLDQPEGDIATILEGQGEALSPKKSARRAVLVNDDVDVQGEWMKMKKRKAIMEKKRLKKLRLKHMTSVTKIEKRVESVRDNED